MTHYRELTEQVESLLKDHRQKVRQIQANRDWSDEKKAQETQKLTDSVTTKAKKLHNRIATSAADTSRRPTPKQQVQADATFASTWARLEPQLTAAKGSLHATVVDLVREAGERGDTETIAALRHYVPSFIHANNRTEPKQARETMITGLLSQLDQAATPFLPDEERLQPEMSSPKDQARLTLLANAMTTGIADLDREVILPDFANGTVTVPSLRAFQATDDAN